MISITSALLLIIAACPVALLLYIIYRRTVRNPRLARQFGCRPAPQFRVRGPFGILEMVDAWRADNKGRLLDCFTSFFDLTSQDEGRDMHTIRGNIFFEPFLVTRDPKNIQALLATQFGEFDTGDARRRIKPLLGSGIFAAEGEAWAHSRALLRPHFSRNNIIEHILKDRHIQNLLKALPSLDTQLAALHRSGADWIEHAGFARTFDRSQVGLAKANRLGAFWWLGMTRQLKEDCAFVHAWVDDQIRRTLALDDKTMDEGYSHLKELTKVTSDHKDLRSQLLSILFAGRDTTASMLSFLFLALSQHPAVFNKLRDAVHEHFGTSIDKINIDSLRSCQYLQWCLKEALRLYHSVPANTRRALVNTTLPRGGGPKGDDPVFLPKGTEVLFFVYNTHRAPEFWGPDGDEFKPERWDGRRGGFDFLPFNAGPRKCLGQQFALTQGAFITARLLQQFDAIDGSAHANDPLPRRWELSLTGKPYDGVKVKLHTASSAD